VESTAREDDIQEVKRCKRHIFNDTSKTAKKLTKPVPTSAVVKLTPKAMLTRNSFVPLRAIDMDTETTGTENAIPEEEYERGQLCCVMTSGRIYLLRNESEQGFIRFRI
jgi:hypothetical protein